MSVSDKGVRLLPSDSMNQLSLGFLETMTVYKLSKLDPHLQDIYSLVWKIMKIHTHTHSFNTGPRARVKGTELQDSMEEVIRPSGGGGAESGGAVILWSAQRWKGVASAGGSRGTGEFSLPGIQGSWKGSWEILDIQVRVIILSDRLQVLCFYVSFQIEARVLLGLKGFSMMKN